MANELNQLLNNLPGWMLKLRQQKLDEEARNALIGLKKKQLAETINAHKEQAQYRTDMLGLLRGKAIGEIDGTPTLEATNPQRRAEELALGTVQEVKQLTSQLPSFQYPSSVESLTDQAPSWRSLWYATKEDKEVADDIDKYVSAIQNELPAMGRLMTLNPNSKAVPIYYVKLYNLKNILDGVHRAAYKPITKKIDFLLNELSALMTPMAPPK